MFYIIIVLFVLLLFFAYFCIKFALIIIKFQDVLEDSLDKIDEKYSRISEILDIPVFFDSPEIKRLLQEIKDIKRVILEISINLSKVNKKDLEKEIQDTNNQ